MVRSDGRRARGGGSGQADRSLLASEIAANLVVRHTRDGGPICGRIDAHRRPARHDGLVAERQNTMLPAASRAIALGSQPIAVDAAGIHSKTVRAVRVHTLLIANG